MFNKNCYIMFKKKFIKLCVTKITHVLKDTFIFGEKLIICIHYNLELLHFPITKLPRGVMEKVVIPNYNECKLLTFTKIIEKCHDPNSWNMNLDARLTC